MKHITVENCQALHQLISSSVQDLQTLNQITGKPRLSTEAQLISQIAVESIYDRLGLPGYDLSYMPTILKTIQALKLKYTQQLRELFTEMQGVEQGFYQQLKGLMDRSIELHGTPSMTRFADSSLAHEIGLDGQANYWSLSTVIQRHLVMMDAITTLVNTFKKEYVALGDEAFAQHIDAHLRQLTKSGFYEPLVGHTGLEISSFLVVIRPTRVNDPVVDTVETLSIPQIKAVMPLIERLIIAHRAYSTTYENQLYEMLDTLQNGHVYDLWSRLGYVFYDLNYRLIAAALHYVDCSIRLYGVD